MSCFHRDLQELNVKSVMYLKNVSVILSFNCVLFNRQPNFQTICNYTKYTW